MKIPQVPPNTASILRASPTVVLGLIQRGPAPEGRYRHWDTVRRIEPSDGATPEQVWAAMKMARSTMYRRVPLTDMHGEAFRYTLADPVLERLHRIDRDASGQVGFAEAVANSAMRERYVLSSLAEEAITSSQLEGAATTRAVAKEMLRTGRAPRTTGERMILGNYRAMQFVRERRHDSLTPEFVFDLHRTVTEGTGLGGEAALREEGDGIAVYEHVTNLLLHQPPPPSQARERLGALCTFANEADTGVFLHPVLKAILLHFWLAYDHPFTDGNGRTARALFYWYMLKEGFWLTEFISISGILTKAPARYAKSFLYTETDDNDLTYFALAQLRVIEQAIEALKAYLRRKMTETRGSGAAASVGRLQPPAGRLARARGAASGARLHVRFAPEEPRRHLRDGASGLAEAL